MNRNRVMWGLVLLVVLTTIAVTVGTMDSHSQQKPQPTPNGYDDMTKYVTAEYDAPESADAKEREERKLRSQRYDGQHWVGANLHPDDQKVGRYDEDIPPKMIPAAESDLVVIGDVVGANAYLSNDKKNVYTEFAVCVEEILKEDAANKMTKGTCITADREGGFVRFPNGQKVLYKLTTRDLPGTGKKYLLFLTNDKKAHTYAILTGYELKESTFIPIDRDNFGDDFTGTDKAAFVKAVRNKISKVLIPANSPNEKKQEQ